MGEDGKPAIKYPTRDDRNLEYFIDEAHTSLIALSRHLNFREVEDFDPAYTLPDLSDMAAITVDMNYGLFMRMMKEIRKNTPSAFKREDLTIKFYANQDSPIMAEVRDAYKNPIMQVMIAPIQEGE